MLVYRDKNEGCVFQLAKRQLFVVQKRCDFSLLVSVALLQAILEVNSQNSFLESSSAQMRPVLYNTHDMAAKEKRKHTNFREFAGLK